MPREVDWSKVVETTLAEMNEDTEIVMPKEAAVSPAMALLPAFLVGGVVGGYAGKNELENKYKTLYSNTAYRLARDTNRNINDFGPDHYTQAKNIVEDLRVVFTPMSVLYVVRGVTIDNIEVKEMNDDMKQAWQRRDAEYFKRFLLNKMMLDMQLAEQMFAKNLVEANINAQNRVLKKDASEDAYNEDVDDYMQYGDVAVGMNKIASLVARTNDSEPVAKYLDFVFSKVASPEDYFLVDIEVNSLRPFASIPMDFGRPLAFYSPLDKEAEYIPPYIASTKGSVVFFPDRAVFLLGNYVLGQISVMQMGDPQTFQAFERKDEEYFMRKFMGEMVEAHESAAEVEASQAPAPIEKVAAKSPVASPFEVDDAHPKIYADLLNRAFGEDWYNWEPELIVKNVEEEFNVSDVHDIAFDKMSFVQLLNTSYTVYNGYHALEKCIRSFNNKFIDFGQANEDMSPGEIVNALKIIVEVTADQDMFDNIGEDAFLYLIDVIANNGVRVVYPIADSPIEDSFYSLVNIELVEKWNKIMNTFVENKKTREGFMNLNQLIKDITLESLNIYRGQFNNAIDESNARYVATAVAQKHDAEDDYIINQTVKNLLINLAIDKYVESFRDTYKTQAVKFLS